MNRAINFVEEVPSALIVYLLVEVKIKFESLHKCLYDLCAELTLNIIIHRFV